MMGDLIEEKDRKSSCLFCEHRVRCCPLVDRREVIPSSSSTKCGVGFGGYWGAGEGRSGKRPGVSGRLSILIAVFCA